MAKIYWDKGHGGSDSGAVGNGLQEKNLTAKIVNYAMTYVSENYIGVEQKCSRSGDETKSLQQRTDEANTWKADVFISVHINSATSSSANGFESYVYNKLGNSKDATIALQNMLHSEIWQIMRAFGVSTDRGKKQANFHVLRESNMRACLTENLFIVNSGDSNKLKNEDFLKSIGEAHARAVAKYLGIAAKPKPVTPAPSSTDGALYKVQVGAFANRENANKLAEKLKSQGFPAIVIRD